jgi:catalase
LFGLHAGFRPVHAKGILLSGIFTPSAGVAALTKAPHVSRPSIRVAVRFSDFAGVPAVPDYDSEGASPRGIAIRFYLQDHGQIIFDPIPRVDSIEPSGDPLLDPRASVYLAGGHRRRAATV